MLGNNEKFARHLLKLIVANDKISNRLGGFINSRSESNTGSKTKTNSNSGITQSKINA